MKDRTNEEGIDPATDKPTDDARRRGALESRDGEKHGTPQDRTMIEDILEPESLAAAWKRADGPWLNFGNHAGSAGLFDGFRIWTGFAYAAVTH